VISLHYILLSGSFGLVSTHPHGPGLFYISHDTDDLA